MRQQLANLQGSSLHLGSSDVLYSPHVIGCHWLCEGLVGLQYKQEAVEIFVDLRVVLHVCTETSPTVMWGW